ncbi:MAG: gluconate 2-dehydrogenase subunit 3 family protein [Verrucomicrobiaceae bacterium]|nr:MAG: gluconate 2-dehydrogenase subunit 3 family protein [Verrucomicrobiaceae bacterium]
MTATVAAHDLTALAQTPQSAPPMAKGYGSDPDLTKLYKPGDVWPLTLSEKERKAAIALADVIFPADDLGPAASTLRVADYIDEWVSAPYPAQQKDRPVILEGLGGLDAQAQKRFTKDFADLNIEQQSAICDDICWPADAKPEFRKAAQFFVLFRSLAAGAYYGTPEGWKALGYVGNVALATFDGPPPEVLERLGLEQTVK